MNTIKRGFQISAGALVGACMLGLTACSSTLSNHDDMMATRKITAIKNAQDKEKNAKIIPTTEAPYMVGAFYAAVDSLSLDDINNIIHSQYEYVPNYAVIGKSAVYFYTQRMCEALKSDPDNLPEGRIHQLAVVSRQNSPVEDETVSTGVCFVLK